MTNPAAWGVSDGFEDIAGQWHRADPSVVDAVLRAMGADDGDPPPPALVTVRLDRQLPDLGTGVIVLEDGGEVRVSGPPPGDLPPGYHCFRPDGGAAFDLVASPGRVPLPERRMWGFSAQLYATRSRLSWGIGDLGDLARLGLWSRSEGANVALINPLHACSPAIPDQPSPYYAGSRCFTNPIYLAVEEIPGAAAVDGLDELAKAGRALNAERIIDRQRVWSLKSSALEDIFASFQGDPGFDGYRQMRGEPLARFATFCALSEIYGHGFQNWPPEYRHPTSQHVRQFARSPAGRSRVDYHAWLQWRLSQQTERAAETVGVVQDLAVAVDPAGADAWIWPEAFASGMRVGAPPDEFNTRGQDWALLPFDPWRLRACGYAPWIESLRAGFGCGRGLRVDHVMGLFRLYWIPEGVPPASGVYVRYPHDDLLNILTLEASRAGAFVVGEDLGTVEEAVRRDLRERQVMSYRVWWFEDRPPCEWPEVALGAVTTHDLPTIAGVVSESDIEAQRRIGSSPNEESSARLRSWALERTGSDENTPVEVVIERIYTDLAQAPCLVLTVTLEDALAVAERPNMPGTLDQWPNWSLALPYPLEEFATLPLINAITSVLARP
jgi:4-alpha-glucanotransferase